MVGTVGVFLFGPGFLCINQERKNMLFMRGTTMATMISEFSAKTINRTASNLVQDLLPYFPNPLKGFLASLSGEDVNLLEEIRLRLGRPVTLCFGKENFWLNSSGKKIPILEGEPFIADLALMERTIALLTASSFYALETELSQGYLTLPGGHRVGFTGEGILDKGQIKGMKYLSSLNFRIAREVIGAAKKLTPWLLDTKGNRIYHSLIISPPGAGKTTILRDLIRQLSTGVPGMFSGVNVGLVDERGEIASSFHGLPQNDVGFQTDVLTGCPKGEAMMILLRTMAPQVIAVDELGGEQEIQPLLEVLNAGISIIATAHGRDLEGLRKRPVLGKLIEKGCFERLVFLSIRLGPGTVEKILDHKGREIQSYTV